MGLFSSSTKKPKEIKSQLLSAELLDKLIEEKRAANSRIERTPRFQKIIGSTAKILGWTIGMGAAQMTAAHYENHLRDRLEKEREDRLLRRTCELNRFGLFQK